MGFSTDDSMVIAGGASVELTDPNAEVGGDFESPIDIGEIAEGGVKLSVQPKDAVQTPMESGKVKTSVTAYLLDQTIDLVNTGNADLAALVSVVNKPMNVTIKQEVPGFSNPRQIDITDAYLVPQIDTTIGKTEAAKFQLRIVKGGRSLSDVVQITDQSNP